MSIGAALRVDPPRHPPDRGGISGHLSDTFWRKPRLLLSLMLAPPVLWLGIVYLGSLLALSCRAFSRSTSSPA